MSGFGAVDRDHCSASAVSYTHLGQQSFPFRFLPESDQRVSGSCWRICAGCPR